MELLRSLGRCGGLAAGELLRKRGIGLGDEISMGERWEDRAGGVEVRSKEWGQHWINWDVWMERLILLKRFGETHVML